MPIQFILLSSLPKAEAMLITLVSKEVRVVYWKNAGASKYHQAEGK